VNKPGTNLEEQMVNKWGTNLEEQKVNEVVAQMSQSRSFL